MSSFTDDEVTTEDKYVVMHQWWQRHCKVFSEWFLTLTHEQRKNFLLKASPDMPTKSVRARIAEGQTTIKATDALLPELALEPFLESNGRIFILFMTRRCTSLTLNQDTDTQMLNKLLFSGNLPSFSGEAFKGLDTPFVDPIDPQETVHALEKDTKPENRKTIMDLIADDKLVHAEVWMALKVRRTAIINLLVSLVETFENEIKKKPSPTFAALIRGELASQIMVAEEAARLREEDDEEEHVQNVAASLEKATIEEVEDESLNDQLIA